MLGKLNISVCKLLWKNIQEHNKGWCFSFGPQEATLLKLTSQGQRENKKCIKNSSIRIPSWSGYTQGEKWHLISLSIPHSGLPWWLRRQRICLQYGRPRFDSWVRKIPWRRKWQPTPVFLPGKSHGQRSLVDYNTRGHKESDTAERLTHIPQGSSIYVGPHSLGHSKRLEDRVCLQRSYSLVMY